MYQLGNIDKLYFSTLQKQIYNPNWFAGNSKYGTHVDHKTKARTCVPLIVTTLSELDTLEGVSDQLFYEYTVSVMKSSFPSDRDRPKINDYFEVEGNQDGMADRYYIISASTQSNEFELYFNCRYRAYDATILAYSLISSHRVTVSGFMVVI